MTTCPDTVIQIFVKLSGFEHRASDEKGAGLNSVANILQKGCYPQLAQGLLALISQLYITLDKSPRGHLLLLELLSFSVHPSIHFLHPAEYVIILIGAHLHCVNSNCSFYSKSTFSLDISYCLLNCNMAHHCCKLNKTVIFFSYEECGYCLHIPPGSA